MKLFGVIPTPGSRASPEGPGRSNPPAPRRTFETIFEEPRWRDGTLVLTGQRKLKRAVEFAPGGGPRKQRRARPRPPGPSRGRRQPPGPRPDLEQLLRCRLAELDALFGPEATGAP